ncbi:MAG: efflux RND transporter periplasmic adaptor subunit [Acidobacteria bacterium]|nr:efflux RND transporter periplasmic adaptor subunit [Acidobacteriota bacterium]
MKHLFWIVPLALIAGAAGYLVQLKNAPPEVRFTRAKVGTIVDTLVTNGKAEPVSFVSVRATRAGAVATVHARSGKTVAAGQLIVDQDNAEIFAARQGAEARVAQIEAEIRAIEGGGRAADRAEIDGQISRLNVERASIDKELGAVKRLIEKSAATKQEAQALEDKRASIDAHVRALQQRRGVLFTPGDRGILEARLREAKTAVVSANAQLERGTLRAPIGGVVYQMDVKAGAYLNPGDLVANIGDIKRLSVNVYVDEPELGRVALEMPVTITWDGLAGREWTGRVDRLPAQIQALGSRQVGEVVVRIDNEDGSLKPGANVNAAIRSREAAGAIIIPKECLRRDSSGKQGVFVVEGGKLAWRDVKIGVVNITHAQVLTGVQSNDNVVLASDQLLTTNLVVTYRAESN